MGKGNISKKGFYSSAGFGFSVERMAKYLGNFEDIEKTRIFIY